LTTLPAPDSRTDTLIFDLDGTLIDSLPDLAAAINRLLAGEGRPALPEQRIRTMVGDGVAKLVERGLAAAGLQPDRARFEALLARFHADYEPRSAEHSQPYPQVADLLPRLARLGWRLAVCTNKPQAATLHILEVMGLAPALTAVAGGDRYGVHKPDPRHLTRLVEELGTVPGRAIMIGDGPQDLAAASGAGMRAIASLYGYGRERMTAAELDRLPLLRTFGDLPDALASAMQ
jgi:phosphoglycolate phosphatase